MVSLRPTYHLPKKNQTGVRIVQVETIYSVCFSHAILFLL